MKTKATAVPAVPAVNETSFAPSAFAAGLNAEADRFHALGLEQAKRHLFTPDPLTERLAREHFVRAETYRTAAKLASA